MLINRNNYESFFLLYADGELSAQEENAVDLFLAANEDLQIEWDTIFAAVLPPEEILFTHKNKLLKELPAGMALQEKMLLAIDNELSSSDDTLFLSDRELSKEYALLLLTKSDHSEIIPFPEKKSLYRREKNNSSVTAFIKGLIVALLLLLIYFIAHSLFIGNKHKPAEEKNNIGGDTAKNLIPDDSVSSTPQKQDVNIPQQVVPQNTTVLRPNEIKKSVTRKDSVVETGIILKDDNTYPGEFGKDSAAVRANVITKPAEEKVTKEIPSVPADANKSIKKKKNLFRKIKDFIEEHIDDMDDADIIIERGKSKPPAKPPVKTSPIKHPPVIEPVKKPDNNTKPVDPKLN